MNNFVNMVKKWNDCKVKSFLKKEVGIIGLGYEARKSAIIALAKKTDDMVLQGSLSFEMHGYFFYKSPIEAIEPDIWYRASGDYTECYKTQIGDQLPPEEYTIRYN